MVYCYMLQKKMRWLLFVVLLFVSGVVALLFSLVMSAIVDCAGKSAEELLSTCIFSIVYVFISILLQAGCGYMKAGLLADIRYNLKNDLFSCIMKQNIGDFETGNSAEYINELNNNVNMYENVYYENIISALQSLISFGAAAAITIMAQPLMLALMIALALITMAVTRLTTAPLEKSTKKVAENVEGYIAEIKDDFGGFRLIYSFGASANILEKHGRRNREMEDAKRENANYRLLCSYTGQLVGLLSTVLVMVMASWFCLRGMFSVGMVIAFGHLIGHIVSPITQIPSIIANFRAAKPLGARFREILAYEKEEGTERLSGLQDGVEIENLSFCYREDREILHQLSFRFKAGGHYAIIGGSGNGKSTILSLLLGYYPGYSGRICFDGIELRKLERSSIENLIGVVSQDTFLFNDTIQNNITLYNDKYSVQEIEKAMEQAGLKKLVDSLPDGISTVINENGRNFSGGEKQRFSVARALLRKNKILLFDEFTANLDEETAREIEEYLLSFQDCLIITVTHRLKPENLRQYDQILVLEQGRIADTGTYDELRATGRYFKAE